MGYSLRRWKVEQNLAALEAIHAAVQARATISLKPEDPENPEKSRWRLSEALASAKLFSSMFGGKYAALRDQVELSISPETGFIIVTPKAKVAPVEPELMSELDVLEALSRYDGSTYQFACHPRVGDEEFVELLAKAGWRVENISRRGKLLMGLATRVEEDEESLMEDILKDLGRGVERRGIFKGLEGYDEGEL